MNSTKSKAPFKKEEKKESLFNEQGIYTAHNTHVRNFRPRKEFYPRFVIHNYSGVKK